MKLNINYNKEPRWGSKVKNGRHSLYGKNSSSSEETAKMLIKTLKEGREKSDIPKQLISQIKEVLFPSM